MKFEIKADYLREELGLVFGFAMVCEIDGEPYYDLHGHHIPDNVMLKASTSFMNGANRVLRRQHGWEDKDIAGQIVFAFPLTKDISDAMGILCDKTGLLVGVKFANPEETMKFRTGEYTGFSIGGHVDDYAAS